MFRKEIPFTKPPLPVVPEHTIMINGSIDVFHHTNKKMWFPVALPFVVTKGKRVIISCSGIYEEDEDGVS